MEYTEMKVMLLDACRTYAERRIETAEQAMRASQAAANEEGKSSAGDKYETGRAMMQIERDKAAQQLEEALKLRRVLEQIDPETNHIRVALGSLVVTSKHKVFLAIGAGILKGAGEDFFVVTPVSPLGKTLLGLKEKDTFVFNKATDRILKIV
jgi:transcription elongation GreA/GreB family factor